MKRVREAFERERAKGRRLGMVQQSFGSLEAHGIHGALKLAGLQTLSTDFKGPSGWEIRTKPPADRQPA